MYLFLGMAPTFNTNIVHVITRRGRGTGEGYGEGEGGRWKGGSIERKKEKRNKEKERNKECLFTRFAVIPVLLD